jgi:alpha-D-ribose 1-methylphosphonate 5-triphosphate synthase subunit PhnG
MLAATGVQAATVQLNEKGMLVGHGTLAGKHHAHAAAVQKQQSNKAPHCTLNERP